MTIWHWLDLLLATGATLRVTRLITTDHLGHWWITDPIRDAYQAAIGYSRGYRVKMLGYAEALVTCPFCIGFWVGVGVLMSLSIGHGPGPSTWEPWRWITGALTLNYMVGHTAARLDRTDTDD